MRGLRWPSIFFALLVASTLVSPLPAAAQDADTSDSLGVDPASEPYAKPEPVDPPTAEERLPVIDLSELPGIWPEDVVETIPGKTDPISPSDALEGAVPLPTEGNETTDIYAVGPNRAEHIAVLSVAPNNVQDGTGEWKDAELTLEPVPEGWRYSDPSGLTFTFPTELSETTPVTVETSDGTLTFASTQPQPASTDAGAITEAEPASSKGLVEGATITYPGAVGGHDLVYIATLLGVQEQIVIEKAPEETTFRFRVGPEGLSLIPDEYGGLDVASVDGKSVGRIPAAVADDSSPDIASTVASYELADLGGDGLELGLVFDPAFFESATYPVIVDPVMNRELSPHRDGYVDNAFPTTNYESNVNLKVGSGKRTFMRFDMSGQSRADRIVRVQLPRSGRCGTGSMRSPHRKELHAVLAPLLPRPPSPRSRKPPTG